MNKNIMDYETVALDEDGKGILIIDQTLLPGRTQILCACQTDCRGDWRRKRESH